ncbi:hypothetical protein CK203_091994 [Vitis vinifera]|uniref:Reverse transcriptase domain-containing protein n=1 Tax=Vitis vinifera TaxID=29760 RepID=A0A438DEZ6_VITVI|nr:hypothetical protein CK203_091994 [Vitis vinifera]
MTERVVRSLGTGRFLEWKVLNACGSAGGILICWDKRVLELLEWEVGVAVGRSRGNQRNLEGPWCLGGDFNITLAQGERNRQGRITSAMRRFAEVVDDLGLVDLQLQGGAFTWTGGLNNMSRAHLDRFLVSPCWLDQFSRGIEVRGSASFRLSAKLKELKQKLKVWNREEFGNLESNKEAAIQQVEYWDRVEDERSLSMEELACKKEAKEVYAKWVELEETHWRQASRELWLKAGDRNTRYFHRMASAHRELTTWTESKLMGLDCQRRGKSEREAEMLEAPFSEGEVLTALMEMNGDKAPGPDGFSVFFWQCCWEFVKEEILEMFKEFHDQNTFLKSINNTFLVLIPKKGGAEDFGDFRPISLLGNAFVKGRQILDASLIANEVIDNWNKKGARGLSAMAEVDVVVYLHSQIFSYVNGTPLVSFRVPKGCVKEIPVPLSFCHGDGGAKCPNQKGYGGGFISGCKIQHNRGRAVHIAHLLFADDTIVFCEAKKDEVQRIEEMAVELGCRVGKLPSVYLGLPLGVPNKAAYGWDGVEEKMRRRLALWKSQYISKGGRITLN